MSRQFLEYHGYVTAWTGWLLAAAPFHASSRTTLKRVAGAMGWQGLKTAAPRSELHELTSTEAPVRVDASTRHGYNTSFYELFVLGQLVADRKPARVFEFGTFNGRTTLNLAINTPGETGIVTIDLPEDRIPYGDAAVGECFAGTKHATRVTQLRGDSTACDFSAYRGRMDFIFVDAGHDYASVVNDTEVALGLANPAGCMIVWHDYSQWPGVQQAVDERLDKDPRFAGVRHIGGTTMAMVELRG